MQYAHHVLHLLALLVSPITVSVKGLDSSIAGSRGEGFGICPLSEVDELGFIHYRFKGVKRLELERCCLLLATAI